MTELDQDLFYPCHRAVKRLKVILSIPLGMDSLGLAADGSSSFAFSLSFIQRGNAAFGSPCHEGGLFCYILIGGKVFFVSLGIYLSGCNLLLMTIQVSVKREPLLLLHSENQKS